MIFGKQVGSLLLFGLPLYMLAHWFTWNKFGSSFPIFTTRIRSLLSHYLFISLGTLVSKNLSLLVLHLIQEPILAILLGELRVHQNIDLDDLVIANELFVPFSLWSKWIVWNKVENFNMNLFSSPFLKWKMIGCILQA